MDIELIGQEKVKIHLSYRDMVDNSLTYGKLSANDPETKAMILSLLEVAKAKLGFEHRDKKLYIETFPETMGGCILYITAIKSNTIRKYRFPCPYVFKSRHLGEIESIANQIKLTCKSKILKSTLYYGQEGYFLVIYPLGDLEKRFLVLASEYMCYLSDNKLYISSLSTRNQLIISNSAVEKLAL